MTFIDRLDYLHSRLKQLRIYYPECRTNETWEARLFAHIAEIEAEITFIEDMKYKEAFQPIDTIKDLIIESK